MPDNVLYKLFFFHALCHTASVLFCSEVHTRWKILVQVVRTFRVAGNIIQDIVIERVKR
jgi:hypothetical protein